MASYLIRFTCLTLALLLLSGCGFKPLYGAHSQSGGTLTQLTQIHINNIADRQGLMLRNKLMDRFYRDGRPADPAYVLDIKDLQEKITDLDITKTSDATRGQLRYDTKMTLKDRASGAILLQRDLIAVTSFNILSSRFTTRVSEDAARQNALEDLARQIENQLALYFNRPPVVKAGQTP